MGIHDAIIGRDEKCCDRHSSEDVREAWIIPIGRAGRCGHFRSFSGSRPAEPGRIEPFEHFQDFGSVRHLIDGVAELCRSGKALGVPADMFTCHIDSDEWTIMVNLPQIKIGQVTWWEKVCQTL